MSNFNRFQSGTSLLLALTLSAGAAAPIIMQAPAHAQAAQTQFSDVSSNYWARPFIQELAQRGVITGFPDGTFRPDAPVTRAQFAAMVRQAFSRNAVRGAINFADVPSTYWAATAIQEAYTTGFLSGYPGNVFQPEQNIPRAQVLVSLANGLNYTPSAATATTLQLYADASAIPAYAQNSIAAATERRIVVNYPSVQVLNPTRAATRAEVAAFIYQALASTGQVASLQSPYIVGQAPTQPQPPQAVRIPAGTTLPVSYTQAERIYISPEEPQPVPVTLQIARDIVSPTGALLIPANSQLVGEIRTVQGGAQFQSQQLVLANGSRLNIDASSAVLTQTETIRRGASLGRILEGAALGAGAAAAVAGVTGDRAIATEEVLGGVGIGGLLSVFLGRERATLIVIDPATDLNVTLNSPLTIQ